MSALAAGNVALVSDAGTPVVSDPGHDLVAAAVTAGYQVVAVPGPSSVVAALSVAGVSAVPFHFLGFLPRRGAARRRVLRSAARWPGTLVLFEARTGCARCSRICSPNSATGRWPCAAT